MAFISIDLRDIVHSAHTHVGGGKEGGGGSEVHTLVSFLDSTKRYRDGGNSVGLVASVL